MKTLTDVERAINELIADGRVIHTGEYRPGRDGKLEPVFMAAEQATPEQLEKWQYVQVL